VAIGVERSSCSDVAAQVQRTEVRRKGEPAF
jgi:hypothetical protein